MNSKYSATLSIIICTLNRWKLLSSLLETLITDYNESSLPLEIIVVDNGSKDQTSDVVRQFSSSMPLKYIVEPKTGLSRARNTGSNIASGKYLIYIDDDCRVPRGWLNAWAEGVKRWPDAAFFGGPITARFEKGEPKWADLENYGFIFCHNTPSLSEGPYPPRNFPWGASMAIRKNILDKIGGFNTDLGLSGKKMISGEETDLFKKAIISGEYGVYLPDTKILHMIEPDRATLRYAWKRSIGQGRTMALHFHKKSYNPMIPFNATIRRFGKILWGNIKTLIGRPSWKAFGRLWVLSGIATGYFLELHEQRLP